MKEQTIEQRIELCKKCPIYNPQRGTCNSKLYLNPETDEVSTRPLIGYVRGCGCLISVKTKNPNSSCVAGKW